MTSLFKRVLLTLSVAMLLSLPISGQDKHFEHNIYIGLGGAHSFEGVDDPYAFHIGYGYDCSFIDIPVLIQYHLSNPRKSGLVVECGPVFSFIASNNQYYIDADPNHPLNDKDIYRSFDFGLQPGIYYQMGKHWRLGVQGHVGLLNLEKDYPGKSGSYHFHDLTATLNFHF